jgi:toxin HigB-1
MIQRFRHKGLERLFARGDTSGVNPKLAAKLRRMLILLDRGNDPSALDMPGYRLHPLKGNTGRANGQPRCLGIGG